MPSTVPLPFHTPPLPRIHRMQSSCVRTALRFGCHTVRGCTKPLLTGGAHPPNGSVPAPQRNPEFFHPSESGRRCSSPGPSAGCTGVRVRTGSGREAWRALLQVGRLSRRQCRGSAPTQVPLSWIVAYKSALLGKLLVVSELSNMERQSNARTLRIQKTKLPDRKT